MSTSSMYLRRPSDIVDWMILGIIFLPMMGYVGTISLGNMLDALWKHNKIKHNTFSLNKWHNGLLCNSIVCPTCE